MINYIKTTWVNNGAPPISAENLNNIENGIEAATEAITNVESGLSRKADKSTSLAGYGINDAYTKAEVDAAIENEINEVAGDIPTKTSQLTNDSGFLTAHQDISGKENTSNKVTSISASSTNTQYPSALAVKNYVDTALGVIENGSY